MLYAPRKELNKPRPTLDWLWPGWIPYGQLTVLVGRAGAGKTTIAQHLVDRCVMKKPAFDRGPLFPRTGKVVWVEADNLMPVTISRFTQLGTDLTRVYPLVPGGIGEWFDLTHDLLKEKLTMRATDKKVDLVVVDSLYGTLPIVKLDRDPGLEIVVVKYLAQLAQQIDCAILLIDRYRNKVGESILKEMLSTRYAHVVIDINMKFPHESFSNVEIKLLKGPLSPFPHPITVQV